MSDIPRFTVDSLLAKYDLEPALKDIYVEGIFDKEILEELLGPCGLNSRVIYEIDNVDIPAEKLQTMGLTSGNKQRVIALAKELSILEGEKNYRCLVDKDLDHWIGPLFEIKNLSWTEYTSIEMYFYSDDFIYDILHKVTKCKINSWVEFSASFTDTLKYLYSLRLADREMNFNLEWIDKKKYLSVRDNCISFDRDKYVQNLLMANSKIKYLNEFKDKALRWLQSSAEPRLFIRGHDFVDMLACSVKLFSGVSSYNNDIAISRLFIPYAAKAKDLISVLS